MEQVAAQVMEIFDKLVKPTLDLYPAAFDVRFTVKDGWILTVNEKELHEYLKTESG